MNEYRKDLEVFLKLFLSTELGHIDVYLVTLEGSVTYLILIRNFILSSKRTRM